MHITGYWLKVTQCTLWVRGERLHNAHYHCFVPHTDTLFYVWVFRQHVYLVVPGKFVPPTNTTILITCLLGLLHRLVGSLYSPVAFLPSSPVRCPIRSLVLLLQRALLVPSAVILYFTRLSVYCLWTCCRAVVMSDHCEHMLCGQWLSDQSLCGHRFLSL